MPKYRVTGPDGATYEIDAPNDEAASAAVAQMFGGEPPPAPAAPPSARIGAALEPPPPLPPDAPNRPQHAPEPSLTDQIMGGLNYADDTGAQALESIRRGVTNVAGLPVDALNASPMLLNLLPGEQGVGPFSDNPVGGSRHLDELLTLGGAIPDAPPAQDPFQRATARTSEELGATAVPVGGLLRIAGMLGREAIGKMPGLARMFLEPAAVDPARFVGKEAAVATGAGAGAGTLNEMTGNQDRENPWIDAGGAIGGATATGVGGSLGRFGYDIFRTLTGNGSYADEVVKDAVMRRIAVAGGVTAAPGQEPDLTPLINQVEQNPRVSDVVPGFNESLADRTRNPGIAALEYSRQGGPNAGTYTQQRADNTAAVDAAMGAVEPQGTPGQFSDPLIAERARRIAEATAQTAGAQSAYDRAIEGLQPVLTASGRGQEIRNALHDASDAAKAVLSEAWRPLDEAVDTPMDVGPLAQSFGQADDTVPVALQDKIPAASGVPARLTSPGTPPQPTGLLDAKGQPIMRPGQAPVTTTALSEIMGIRTALTDELLTDITPQQIAQIEERLTRLDSYLDQNVPAELREQYDAARAATVDFNDRFTRPQTAIAQTLRERQRMAAADASTVAPKFVQNDEGRIADFEALMREAGNDDRVQTAVRDQILADVRDRGLMENPEGLRTYLGQYNTVFERFPQLREDLGNAASLRTQLDEAQGAEQTLTQTLTQQGKSTVANYLSYGDENAERAMSTVLAARKPGEAIDELLTFVGDDPKAVEGARKVFWDILQGKSRAGGRTTATIDGTQPWSPFALNAFLDNPANAAVAERLWRDNPEHLARIREIAAAISGVDVRNAAKAPNTSGTPQGSFSHLLTPETLQSRFYAYQSGRISGSFLITALVSTLIRRGVRKAQEEGYQRMLDDVLTNADTAAELMKANNPANRAALARKAKLWFGNEASTIINAMSGDDEDEENAAIMREGAPN